MPTTRSQAKSEQPSGLVSSSRANPPRRSNISRQGDAVVTRNAEVGTPSSEMANREVSTENFMVAPCNAPLCKTCAVFVTAKEYRSNVTSKKYPVINHSGENLSCKSENLIYLLSCGRCNMQYVGETMIPLHRRINIQ